MHPSNTAGTHVDSIRFPFPLTTLIQTMDPDPTSDSPGSQYCDATTALENTLNTACGATTTHKN